VHSLAVASMHAQDLDRLIACWAEPVREARIELGNLARPHCDVVLAQNQPHLAGQDVEPLVAVMSAKLALPFRRDDDLPNGEPT
jgi:hypothetical protein